jgi:endonuclease YncB( thermonuclease family)
MREGDHMINMRTITIIAAARDAVAVAVLLLLTLGVAMLIGVKVAPAQTLIVADVERVVDGDSMVVWAIPFPDERRRLVIRIAGIDTPEINGRCEAERELARRARARTTELAGRRVVLRDPVTGQDPYGRVLAHVFTRDGMIEIGATLILEGLARVWDGARRPWCP